MALSGWFLKHYNSDVTGVGKAPLRKRFSKFRESRINSRLKRFRDTRFHGTRAREKSFAGVKKKQDVEGIKPDSKYYQMGVMGK